MSFPKPVFPVLLASVLLSVSPAGEIPSVTSPDGAVVDTETAVSHLLVNRAIGGRATASKANPPDEDASMAFDGSPATQWFNHPDLQRAPTKGWLQYQFPNDARWAVIRYRITPGKGFADRDPREWKLLGSNDGFTWAVLDTRTNENFSERRTPKTYAFANETAYAFYRLTITRNNGNPYGLRLAELELLAPSPLQEPTGLGTATARKEITLSWTRSPDATGYQVKRASAPDGTFAIVAADVKTTSYRDTGVEDGIAYRYTVAALGPFGPSVDSREVTATLVHVDTPSNLTGEAGQNRATLSWNPVEGGVTYSLKRADAPAGPFVPVAVDLEKPSCADAGLTAGNTYYYVVSASKPGGESDDSVVAKVAMAPDAPANFTVSLEQRTAVLGWTAVPGATSYTLQRSFTAKGHYRTVAKGITTNGFTDDHAGGGRTCYYVVQAVNDGGKSPVTAPVSIRIPRLFSRN